MLCLSIQYALVEVDEVLHHDIGTEHIHTVGESHSNDEAHDENHCQHCCHSHACNLGVNNSSIDLFTSTDDHFQAPGTLNHILSFLCSLRLPVKWNAS